MELKERPVKAFLISLGLMAISFPIILVPFMTILFLTLAPFHAGYRGGKHVTKKASLLIGAGAGLLWSAILICVIYAIVSSVFGPFFKYEPIGALLIFIIFLCNTAFASVGAFVGAGEREREDEYAAERIANSTNNP